MGAASGNCEVKYTVEFRVTEDGSWQELERFDDHDEAIAYYKDQRKRRSSDIELRLVRWAGTVVRPK